MLGVGHSLAAIQSSLHGDATIAMHQGSLSGLLVEAAGLDVIEALGLVLADHVRVAIRCARLDVAVNDGVADISRLLVDATDALLVAGGEVDLGKEQLDIQIEASAKDFSLIDVNAPVRVGEGFPISIMRSAGSAHCPSSRWVSSRI